MTRKTTTMKTTKRNSKPLTATQREARRRRTRNQMERLKAEVEAARRERVELQAVSNVVVPLVRPARGDEQFESSTFCGLPIKVLRVEREEA